MNWEAVAAISTPLTGLVIAITAILGFRQLRIGDEHARSTRDQLEHLRKATQFEGALAVFGELDKDFQVDARRFVQFELAQRMKEPAFRAEVALIAGADEREHKELTVLRCFERIGFYIDKGFVDPDVLYMVASGRVITTWRALEEVVAIHRGVAGAFWTHFEKLYYECRNWMKHHNVRIDDLEAAQIRAYRSEVQPAQSGQK
jgi:hypothetical protein